MRVRLKRAAVEIVLVRRNLTKTALALHAGLHRTHLSDLLAGRAAPGPQTRRRMLETLGGEFDDYFEIEDRRGRASDGERVLAALEFRRGQTGAAAAAALGRLTALRDALRAGTRLPAADRVWIESEWKHAQAARRTWAGARRASARRSP